MFLVVAWTAFNFSIGLEWLKQPISLQGYMLIYVAHNIITKSTPGPFPFYSKGSALIETICLPIPRLKALNLSTEHPL